MPETKTILINAQIELSIHALETIVETAKQLTGRNDKGHYHVETADVVNRLISLFLAEKDFDSFVADGSRYEIDC